MARCGVVTGPDERTTGPATPYRAVVAGGLPELDQRLSDELDTVNAAATGELAPSRELTVQIVDDAGELAAGSAGGRGESLPASG